MKGVSRELKTHFLFEMHKQNCRPHLLVMPQLSLGSRTKGSVHVKAVTLELAKHFPSPKFPHRVRMTLWVLSSKCLVRWQPHASHVYVLQLPTGENASRTKEKENTKNNYRSLLDF